MTAAPSGATVLTGSLRGGTATSLAADDDGHFQINSTTSGTRTSAFQGSFTGVSNDLGGLKVTYKGKNSKSTTQTVAIWNWATNAWVQLDSRTVGENEVLVEKSPTGSLADYVSGTSGAGEVLVRIRATRNSANFYASGDLMRIAYTLAG